MLEVKRFVFSTIDNQLGMASSLPYMPITLNYQNRELTASGLLVRSPNFGAGAQVKTWTPTINPAAFVHAPDRGHMAPNYAIAMRYGVGAQYETFFDEQYRAASTPVKP